MCLTPFLLIGEFKEYKGYTGSIEYSMDDRIHFGKILKIDDHVDYKADNIIDLEKQFHEAVDDYIEFKEENKKEKSAQTIPIEVNSHGVNKLIKYNILSDERMKEIGFRKNYYEGTDYEEYSPYWWFSKIIKFPNDKRWKNIEIDFDVKIPKDGSDLNIMVLDMDFCQPYDYQRILSKNPSHPCASIVNEQVEEWMKYLQDNGVLSGHVYGEYI